MFRYILVVLMSMPCLSLICYECKCYFNPCECINISNVNDNTHCIIRMKKDSFITLSRIDRNLTELFYENRSYIIFEESIIYNKKLSNWYHRSNDLFYICNWNNCNNPNIISNLSVLLKIHFNKRWLTENIFSNNSMIECYRCPNIQCNNSIDFNQCLIDKCIKSKICISYNFDEINEECLSKDIKYENNEKYKIEIKLIIYLNENSLKYHLWKLNVFCNDNYCFHPKFFQEIKKQISIELNNNLTILSFHPHPEYSTTSKIDYLNCYKCFCPTNSCNCITIEENSRNNKHCLIIQTFSNNKIETNLTEVNNLNFNEYPYILIQESIYYNKIKEDWFSKRDFIIYGCNSNLCNEYRLSFHLFNIFHMFINKSWLNKNLLNTQLSKRNCSQCSSNIQCIYDLNQCFIAECNKTCLLSNKYNHFNNNEQCYQSSCHSSQFQIILQGILYLNRSKLNVELWEISFPCYVQDCSQTKIFEEIKKEFYVEMGNLNGFINQLTTSTISSTTTTTTSMSIYYNRDSCNNTMLIPGLNGTCITLIDANDEAVDFLLNEINPKTTNEIANALTIYFSANAYMNINMNMTEELNKRLTPTLIDIFIGYLNRSIIQNSSTSFVMCQYTNKDDLPLGILFHSGIGGEILYNSTINSLEYINSTTAILINPDSLIDNEIISINMLIIDKPPIEYNCCLNDSNGVIVLSSIIVIKIKGNYSNLNVSLYFNIESNKDDGNYYCTFYDRNLLNWNSFGCSQPIFNLKYHRYECYCNHLTSFALIWLPNRIKKELFNIEDICSLIFQFISILCFLIILIHNIIYRIQFEIRDLMPFLSCISTILLFSFYITLSLIVYIESKSFEEKICFLKSRILMFIVYFLLILMFCIKTSVAYFNYLRFVQPIPSPSLKQFHILLILSFLISIIYLIFAIGFYLNSSFSILKLYPYRICWFNENVIHYFLTIPISISLLLNILMIILVGKSLINHSYNKNLSNEQSNKRIKLSIIVLLCSSITQGIGWLFGPLLSLIKLNIFIWFFIIFNGLEGLWSILLYIIIIRIKHKEKNIYSNISQSSTKLSIRSSQQQKRL